MLRRSHSSIQAFDIQLQGNTGKNDDIVLLSGPPLEASANHLTGHLILNSLDTMSIKRISVKLLGTLRLKWNDQNVKPGATLPLKYEKTLYAQELDDFEIPGRVVNSNSNSQRATPAGSLTNLASYFGGGKHKSNGMSSVAGSPENSPITTRTASSINLSSLVQGDKDNEFTLKKSRGSHGSGGSLSSKDHHHHSHSVHQVAAGSYRFPFELMIPGDLNESIEGNRHAQLAYWLVATVERGFMQHTLSSKKHIRIIRTIGVDNYDIAHTVSIENTWPNKVEYKIDIPCKAVPVGSQLEVHFSMVPIGKGLKLGKIRAEIVEYITLATLVSGAREEEHIVAQQMFDTPSDFDQMADQWDLIKFMDVPRSLSRCTQDVVVQPYTKINHKFRCFISLINSDGHTSELRASLPITLYISPNVYVTGNNDEGFGGSNQSKTHITTQTDHPIFNVERQPRLGQASSAAENDVNAPPTYSHHVYDRLYSTVATPAISPGQSGTTTPHMSPSRPSSPLNLQNLDASQQAQLAAGLRALALNRQSSFQAMPELSRNNSSSVDVVAMSRVPSYDQAIGDQTSNDAAPDYSN